MVRIETPKTVYEAASQVKADARAFGSNFYPSPPKLEEWIRRGRLWMEHAGETLFIFRRECDFWRLFYCAASPEALERDASALCELRREKIVSDIIGGEPPWLAALGNAGLRRYKTLLRMARPARQEEAPGDPWLEQVALARESDAAEALGLIEAAFDRYAKQIPPREEIEAAIRGRSMLILRLGSEIAGLLYFENHGVASTLRFWTVARRFRDRHLGAALMRRYLASQQDARRFVLWVDEGNDDAIQKYRRFHYESDGLADDILANDLIST